MIQHRIGLGQLIALPLARHHMQELRTGKAANVLKRGNQRVQVVTVDRPDVVESELLEHGAGNDHALGMLLQLARQFEHRRKMTQHLAARLLGGGVELAAHQARQIPVQCTDRRRDRHVIVVQDHQQAHVFRHAGVVQCLERHAGRHGAIADDRDRVSILAAIARCHRHAQCGGNRGRRMRGPERVVGRFDTARKPRDAGGLPQAAHRLAASGQDLVRIGLVPHVPHDPVFGRLKHVMQCDRQFDRTQIGTQVPAGPRNGFEQEGTQFFRQNLQLAAVKLPKVRRIIDGLQQAVHDQLRRCTIRSASCLSRIVRGWASAPRVESAS